jgi:hypothetical protein
VRLRNPKESGKGPDNGHGNVDEEDGTPPKVGEQPPSRDWTYGNTKTGGPRPDPNGSRACSEGSRNTSAMIGVAGMVQAAPTPMIARAEIRVVTESEKAEYAEPTAKINSPAIRTRLRPKRSPTLPATRSRPAKTQA